MTVHFFARYSAQHVKATWSDRNHKLNGLFLHQQFLLQDAAKEQLHLTAELDHEKSDRQQTQHSLAQSEKKVREALSNMEGLRQEAQDALAAEQKKSKGAEAALAAEVEKRQGAQDDFAAEVEKKKSAKAALTKVNEVCMAAHCGFVASMLHFNFGAFKQREEAVSCCHSGLVACCETAVTCIACTLG